MNNVLLWIGGLLVAVLCALFAGPHFVDWTRYRGVFEEEASRVLGREVRVAGAVNLRLLPTPYVRFEKVRLADAAGQTGEPYFRADDFTLWLAPAPLLRGAIEARELELRRPTLKLRLNAEGGGNWQTLSIARGSLPFIPSDVALQSVLISDGTISIDDSTGDELVRVGGITGELNVAALDGPYKFRGALDLAGLRHELKVSTTAFEADSSLRMKAQVTVPSTTSAYMFDGRVADLTGRAKLDGQITGQVAILPASIGQMPGSTTAAPAAPARLAVDLRALVTADTGSAKLADIGLAFEQDGKPQLIAGSAQVTWQGGLDVQTEFNTRWIDLDQLLGSKDSGTKPLEALRRLAAALVHLAPASGRGRTAIKADQITLGGDSLGGAQLQVDREDTTLRLTDLRINLPGGTRAQLSGLLAAAETFDGDINLRGANLSRMMTWLGHGAVLAEGRTEGAFSLKSKIAFDQQSIAIRDASASLGSAVATGSVAYRWSDRPRLDVAVEGDQIDLGLVSPRALELLTRARELVGGDQAKTTPGGTAATKSMAFTIDPRAQDATLRIRAGRLLDGNRELRDVDVDASLINGQLVLKRMRFASGTGLELEAEGEIADIGAKARGGLRGTVGAADEAAVAELLELFDQPQGGTAFKRLRSVAPARAAWTVRFGDAKDTAPAAANGPAEIWLDGTLLGRRLTATVRLDGGLRHWRQYNLQVNAAIERPDWQRLRALLAIEPAATAMTASKTAGLPAAAAPSRAKLLLKLSGRPDQALSTFLKLEDEAFDAGLSGRLVVGTESIGSAEGEMQLRSSDMAQALTALGVSARSLPAIAIEGAAELVFKDDILKLTPSALEVAGAVVGGELTVARAKDKDRQRVEGRLSVSHVNVARLLDLLVEPHATAPREAEPQIWSASAFDFSALDRVEGRVRIEVGDLGLTADLGLGRGVVETEFGPGKVNVVSLEGDLLGTRLTSRWLLEKAAAGASLNGSVKVGAARLDHLTSAENHSGHRIAGTASLAAAVAGRGLSPRSLVAALAGKGEIDIAKGETGSISPLILRRVSDEAVTGKREPTVENVEQGVLALLYDPAPELKIGLGNRKLGFDVVDGAVRVRSFTVETPEGRATNRTTIDLASLKIDSEWKIEQRVDKAVQLPPAPGTRNLGPLPPIVVVFVGPAAALGRLDPVISVDALVRELSVRRMERDVEDLERMREVDEERARVEAERQKAEAAARAAAAAPATVPGPGQLQPATAVPDGAQHLAPANAAPALVPPQIPGGIPAVVQGADAWPTTTQAPQGLPGTTPTDGEPSPETKRRGPSALTSEPRQVPSSQQFKNSRARDVFRRQELGGN
jgi:uncharacterized protein involved in outer membrane biogenesis